MLYLHGGRSHPLIQQDSLAPERTAPLIDVLVQGAASVDLTFLGLPELPRLGQEYYATGFGMNPGACFITVNALRRLGLRTGFSTDLGNDFFSRYVLDCIRSAGIDQTFIRLQDRDLSEVSVGLSFPHDRTYITWDATPGWSFRAVQFDDLRSHRVRCLFTHVALDADVFAEARSQGIPICVDAFWNPAFLTSRMVWDAIGQADVFMPNLIEACKITGTTTPEAALASLAKHVPMVAIKLGPDGAIGCADGVQHWVPALPVAAVDTTGAGDNFDAGFMYGLVRGLPFDTCLRCAVVAGSLSTQAPGGVTASPDEQGLLQGLDGLARRERADGICLREDGT
jgi:sugar/nucleoside kinase (ribokinase family)